MGLGALSFFLLLQCHEPLEALYHESKGNGWSWQELALTSDQATDLAQWLNLPRKVWQRDSQREAFFYIVKALDGLTTAEEKQTIKEQLDYAEEWWTKGEPPPRSAHKYHLIFALHPELFPPLIRSIEQLLKAAKDPNQKFKLDELMTHLEKTLLNLTAKPKDRLKPPRKLPTGSLGFFAELRAAAYLSSKGYHLVAFPQTFEYRNNPERKGEIDLLIQDPNKPEELIAVEVKTQINKQSLQNENSQYQERYQLLQNKKKICPEGTCDQAIEITEVWIFSIEPVKKNNRILLQRLFPEFQIHELPLHLQRKHIFQAKK